eukprot:SAG31_NODE_491_length_14923_cov_12.905221_6_plen_72_part_00
MTVDTGIAVISTGCVVGNACAVGALVKLNKGQELAPCTVVYGAQNTSHILPRPEAEVREQGVHHLSFGSLS